MKRNLRVVALLAGIGVALVCVASTNLLAQNEDQQAYQAGYQNGIAAARDHRPMNPNTYDWHGDRLTAYQRGYEQGYRSVEGHERWEHEQYAGGPVPDHWHDAETQKAYQSGFANGVTDAQNRRAMRPNSEDWHGDRLTAYQEGYERGYHSIH